jgi:hypothetical protein
MTTKHQVIALFHKNPNATSAEIADKLDCESAYVRATLRRNGLKLQGSLRRNDPSLRRGVMALGYAAQDAGLTVGEIERIGLARISR